jgi:hypothetical protein
MAPLVPILCASIERLRGSFFPMALAQSPLVASPLVQLSQRCRSFEGVKRDRSDKKGEENEVG